MAIYHFHMKILSRSAGRNVVAAAAYRHAAKFHDERENQNYDFSKKDGVVHKEILFPENSPDWVFRLSKKTPDEFSEKLWNLVEQNELRKDSQLSREVVFALPIELTQGQNIILAREFIKDQFVLRGMIADWSFHADEDNPHVHVMLTMRSLEENGFGLKMRDWNKKELIEEWRERWSEYTNFHLKLNNHTVRIDHRSYQEQGIDLVPSAHQGKAVTDMDRRRIQTDVMNEANRIRKENLRRISEKPEILLHKLSSQYETFTTKELSHELGRYVNDQGMFFHKLQNSISPLSFSKNPKEFIKNFHSQGALTAENITQILKTIEHHESVFTEKHLIKAVAPYTDNAESLIQALVQLKNTQELLYVGVGEDGRERFTTRRMFRIENDIQKIADQLRKNRHVEFPENKINKILEKYQNNLGKKLSDEQLSAVKHVLKPKAISCVVGRAGTGKSFSLGAARSVWEAQGLRVQGIALSGIAAEGLRKDAGISSRTIQSFQYVLEKKQITLNHHDVIVMDEAGMTDSVSMLSVLKAVKKANAKLVLVGDHAQIQPVGPGATFRALLERTGFTELQTIYRQKEKWQREATISFSQGKVSSALKKYAQGNNIHFDNDEAQSLSHLVKDFFEMQSQQNKPFESYLIIAHRNKDVSRLNEMIRNERVNKNEISEGYIITGKYGEMKISKGDRLLFLKNDRGLGVSNGRFATIESVEFTENGVATNFKIKLDGDNKIVTINPKGYSEFAYGYAATVHKVQGTTVDHSFVYSDGYYWNRHLTYVALSRHRETCQLYTSDKNMTSLTSRLGRVGIKDSLLDFPLAFAARRDFDITTFFKDLQKHLLTRLKVFKEKLYRQLDKIFISENLENSTQPKNTTRELSDKKLEDALLDYVEKEIELTQMVSSLYKLRKNDPKAAKLFLEHILIHSNKLKDMAKEILAQPEITKELLTLKNKKSPKLTEVGGFNRIREKIKNNGLCSEDIQVLALQLQQKAFGFAHQKTQEKDRDGRTR